MRRSGRAAQLLFISSISGLALSSICMFYHLMLLQGPVYIWMNDGVLQFKRVLRITPTADGGAMIVHQADRVNTMRIRWNGHRYLELNGPHLRKPRRWLPKFHADSVHVWIELPLWIPIVFFALTTSRMLWPAIRRRWRRRHSLCEHCAYDLCESPQRCPECGQDVNAPIRQYNEVRWVLCVTGLTILALAVQLRGMLHYPLHRAATAGDVEKIQALLVRGADLEQRDEKDMTPLIRAILLDNGPTVELLIRSGANVNADKSTLPGNSSLTAASYNDNWRIVELLLAHGADPDTQNSEQETALHHAVAGRNLEIVRLLLRHGANINTKDGRGTTPLALASRLGYDEIVEVLSQEAVSTPDVMDEQTAP